MSKNSLRFQSNSRKTPCGPVGYGSKKKASTALTDLIRIKPYASALCVYRCSVCRQFHIGSPLPGEEPTS